MKKLMIFFLSVLLLVPTGARAGTKTGTTMKIPEAGMMTTGMTITSMTTFMMTSLAMIGLTMTTTIPALMMMSRMVAG